jgi:hypothetical protein
LLQNPIRGGQGPNWAVEPYDDDDDDMIKNYTPKGRRNQGRHLKRLLDA